MSKKRIFGIDGVQVAVRRVSRIKMEIYEGDGKSICSSSLFKETGLSEKQEQAISKFYTAVQGGYLSEEKVAEWASVKNFKTGFPK